MFNKAALSSYRFPYANVITLLQVFLFQVQFPGLANIFYLYIFGMVFEQLLIDVTLH